MTLQRSTRLRRKRRGTPADVAAQVALRSQGWCEWPSCPERATDLHHRLTRAHGGPDTVDNLAALCRAHHRLIHANPADSYESGWLIRGVK